MHELKNDNMIIEKLAITRNLFSTYALYDWFFELFRWVSTKLLHFD